MEDYREEEVHILAEDFQNAAADERKRLREEKRRRRKYKFSDKKHSVTGIISSCLALAAIICMAAAIVVSAKAHGSGGTLTARLGAVSFIFSIAGIILGLVSFRKTDVYYTFAWTGLIASGIIWLLCANLIVIGL